MPTKSLNPNPFVASSPRSGDANTAAILRGKNMWIRGTAPHFYAECYQGSENLNETLPSSQITGTLSFTAGSKSVTGNATSFLAELHVGQFIFSNDEIFVVERIKSDFNFIAHRAPGTSGALKSAYRLRNLFALDRDRASLVWGNAMKGEQGTLIAVGDGTLLRNGAALPGASLVASRSPKIAIYNPATATFTVYTLGMTAPTGITVANVAGGSKGMTAGQRSFRFVKGRKETGGFGNPGATLNYTLTAGEKPRISFPARDAAEGQTLWIGYGTEYETGTSVKPVEGPWYRIKQLKIPDDVPATGGNYDLEYLNSEINRAELLSFNNDAPPDAEFVAALVGYPIYISCQGEGTVAKPNGTSPGPFIVPAKPNNIEAAPLVFPNPVAVSPVENIIGHLEGEGRIFLMTANRLAFASFTGNANFPVTIRPYWKRGFANPYSLVMVDGEIFGSTTSGMMRSIASAEAATEAYSFASDVEELLVRASVGHRLVGYDPKNEAVCVFHSGAYKNDAGYWTTVVYPFLLKQKFWSTPIVLESMERDMIVSGLATVGDYLEFVAGGKKKNSGTIESRTYRFDTGNLTPGDEPVEWSLAWSFRDDEAEDNAKIIKGFRVKGKYQQLIASVHGSRSKFDIDVDELENLNDFGASGAFPLPDSLNVGVSKWSKLTVRELLQYTFRLKGIWSGAGIKDRIEKVSYEVNVGGFRK